MLLLYLVMQGAEVDGVDVYYSHYQFDLAHF